MGYALHRVFIDFEVPRHLGHLGTRLRVSPDSAIPVPKNFAFPRSVLNRQNLLEMLSTDHILQRGHYPSGSILVGGV
jgi:hypothetical protein